MSLLLAFVSFAYATTYDFSKVESSLKKAPLIAEGYFLEKEALATSGLGYVTVGKFQIDKVLQWVDDGGSIPKVGDTLWVETPGGENEKEGIYYTGLPRILTDTAYRAYLTKKANGNYAFVGLENGLVPLVKTRDSTRNRTDGSNGAGSGAFLHWDQRYMPIPFFLNSASFKNHADFGAAIETSFKTWRDATGTYLDFIPMGCTTQRYNENDGINTIALITDEWLFDSAAIAITRNFYLGTSSMKAGLILDSDILLNGVNYQFTTTGQASSHDIQNILTHEIGHFIGLGHESGTIDTEATMYSHASVGETKKRTLKTNDLTGLRSAYAGTTNKIASYTFSSTCLLDTVSSGCLSVPGREPSFRSLWIYILMLGASFLIGRKKMNREIS